MTSITHALIGASIAAKTNNPYVAAPVALGLHFVADLIPHWDLGTNHRKRPKWVTGSLAIVETLIALTIGIFLFLPYVPSSTTLVVAIIFSLLPDWIEAPYHILKPNAPKFLYYLYKPQSVLHARAQLPWGMVTQVVTAGVALYIGFFF